MKLNVIDWNIIPYADAWTRQTEWFDALVRAKQAGEEYENHIILCEHPHVYTLGRYALPYRPGWGYYLSRAGAIGMLSYPEP